MLLLYLCLLQFGYSQSVDKSGVTPNTISLPSGPGSIEGLGESFQPTLNTGQASYKVQLVLPKGTAGHTPNLALNYNGGNANSAFGYGWSMNLPRIQRQCDKGIPLYVEDANGLDDDRDGQIDEADELDVFINEMKEELVLTESGYYFCENEEAFIRYEKVGDHWEGKLPNGTLMEFGITASARIFDAETYNVQAWLLEKMTDLNGNTIVFSYTAFDCLKDLNQKYLSKVEYGAGAPPWKAFHFAFFEYEDRFDWFEDCRAGFKIRTGHRLKKVSIGTQGTALGQHLAGDFNEDGQTDYLNRQYQFNYEAHPHWSLLSNVSWLGSDGITPYPPIRFQYSSATPPDTLSVFDKVIGEENAPFHLMDNPLVDLIDMNGDALPDLLKTEQFGGQHTVYLNQGEKQGQYGNTIAWSAGEKVRSLDGFARNVNLQDAQNTIAHLADMDGDGFSDLVYKAAFGDVYYFPNTGEKSWGARQLMSTTFGNSAPPSPFGAGDVKTADVDFDKNIDVIQSISVGDNFFYRIWLNLGNQQYSQAVTVPQEKGFDLSQAGVHIADFNGDRVPDILQIQATGLNVTAGLGHGQFDDPMFVPMPDYLIENELLSKTKLQDLNGDGLVDLVIEDPAPNQLWYWLNLGNYALDKQRVIIGTPSIFSLNPSIRWTDMNGNGTTDFVYADANAYPRLQIIDIGALMGAVPSPNLLLQVDNGIGQKTNLAYSTSTEYVLKDRAKGVEWTTTLPFPVNVVSKSTISDGMGNDYETEFTYRNGYYDGEEKEFRGFAMVESREIGDASAPDLLMVYEFNTGAIEEALKGKQLSAEARNATGEVFYKETQNWQTRDLYYSSNLTEKKVSFPYPSEKVQDVIEKGNGMPVQLKWEYEYDNYGNQTKQIEYGRLDAGWDDERVSKSTFSAAYEDGIQNWIINLAIEQSITDEKDTLVAHTKFYYDGNQDLGKLDKSNISQIEKWVDADKYITSIRNRYDAYGNIIAILDPLYGRQAGHYREIKYDPLFHTYPVEEIIYTGKETPATLNHQATYDYGLGVLLTSTEFNGRRTSYEYDPFARLRAETKPLDTLPTIAYEYVLGRPYTNNRTLNWIETRQLDNSEGDGYLHSRTFIDGLGREIMTRAEGEFPGQIVVNNTIQFNKRKLAHKKYLPYFESGDLDFKEPSFHTAFTEHFYDALSRPIRTNQPIGPEGVVFSQIQYAPLSIFTQDEEQSNPNSKHFGCGKREVSDGLKDEKEKYRIREVYQLVKLSDQGESIDNLVEWKSQYQYDLLDNPTNYTDAQFNQRLIAYDGLGRRTFENDPNRGVMRYTYDDAGNIVKTQDANTQIIRYSYDGLNRLTEEFYSNNQDQADITYHYDMPFGTISKGAYWQSGSTKVEAQNTLGYLSWVEDETGEEHHSYDARGRNTWIIKRIKTPNNDGLQNFYTGYQYDPMGRVVHLYYPDATQLTYSYNHRGLLESIPNFIEELDYNPASQRAKLKLNCGTLSTYHYDQRLRLNETHTIREADTLILQHLNHTLDGLAHITEIRDGRSKEDLTRIGEDLGIDQLEAQAYNATQSFAYDNLYRLVEASNPSVYGAINYRYDRTGNMLYKNAHLINPNPEMNLGAASSGGVEGAWGRIGRSPNSLAGPNALTSAKNGELTFSYDANGNMTSDARTTYHWDAKDRLNRLETENSVVQYRYDYNDLRKTKMVNDSLKSIYIDKYSEIRGSQLIKYVHNGLNRIAQIKEDTTFFLHDHLGTTSISLNKKARVLEQIASYPYGQTRKANRSDFKADYTFTGKEKDQESEHHYFDARYYNSSLGRFLSVDAMAEKHAAWSPYNYALNNPMLYIDPDGNDVLQIGYHFEVNIVVNFSIDFGVAFADDGVFLYGSKGSGLTTNVSAAAMHSATYYPTMTSGHDLSGHGTSHGVSVGQGPAAAYESTQSGSHEGGNIQIGGSVGLSPLPGDISGGFSETGVVKLW